MNQFLTPPETNNTLGDTDRIIQLSIHRLSIAHSCPILSVSSQYTPVSSLPATPRVFTSAISRPVHFDNDVKSAGREPYIQSRCQMMPIVLIEGSRVFSTANSAPTYNRQPSRREWRRLCPPQEPRKNVHLSSVLVWSFTLSSLSISAFAITRNKFPPGTIRVRSIHCCKENAAMAKCFGAETSPFARGSRAHTHVHEQFSFLPLLPTPFQSKNGNATV